MEKEKKKNRKIIKNWEIKTGGSFLEKQKWKRKWRQMEENENE